MNTETTNKPGFDRKKYQRERYHALKAKNATVPSTAPVQYAGETPAEQAFSRIVVEAPSVSLSDRG